MKPKLPSEGKWKICWWLFGLLVPKQGEHSQNRAAPDSAEVLHAPAPALPTANVLAAGTRTPSVPGLANSINAKGLQGLQHRPSFSSFASLTARITKLPTEGHCRQRQINANESLPRAPGRREGGGRVERAQEGSLQGGREAHQGSLGRRFQCAALGSPRLCRSSPVQTGAGLQFF